MEYLKIQNLVNWKNLINRCIKNICSYKIEIRRHDVGNKSSCFEEISETALKRENLRESFMEYLVGIIKEKTKASINADKKAVATI